MPVHAYEFFTGVAEIAAFRFVDKSKISAQVGFEIAVLNLFNNSAVSLFGLAKRFFHLFAFGDIACYPAEADDFSLCVFEHCYGNFVVCPGSVFSDERKIIGFYRYFRFINFIKEVSQLFADFFVRIFFVAHPD